ncbi:MAG: FAD-binding protein, partial [Woeseiaceae bacterium]
RELAVSGAEHNPHIRDHRTLRFLKETLFGNDRLVDQLLDECDHFVAAATLPELLARMQELDGNSDVQLANLKEAAGNFDQVVARGESQWNDDQLRRIQHARAWRSDRIRTCKPKPILDPGSGPLIAIKLRLITRKSLGGIQTDLKSRVLTPSGEPVPGLFAIGEAAGFGGGGASGRRSLEGTFLSGCILTARAAASSLAG